MDRRSVAQRPVFYGWWMVAGGMVSTMVTGGLYVYGFSTYFLPLIAEFGWSRTALAGVISLSRLEGGLIGPIAGYLIDRFGPRPMMLVGTTVMAAGFVLLALVQDFLGFALVYILVLSVGSSFGTTLPIQTALTNWFVRRRSFVIGLLFAGFGLGGFIIPVTAWMINSFGWRMAAVATGVIIWVAGIPVALLMRHRPEAYGELPDGGPLPQTATGSTTPAGATAAAASQDDPVDFTPGEALRTPAFWLLSVAWLMWSTLPSIITVHMVPFFVDAGFTPQFAATVFGMYAVVSGLSRVPLGWLGDQVNKRYLLAFYWTGMIGGLFLLARVQTVWDVALFIAVFGPCYGGAVPMRGVLQAEYFGRKYFATISGLTRPVDLAGTVAGPVAIAWAFDNAGGIEGYRLAFMVLAVINVLGLVAVLAARKPVLKRAVAVEA